jgi:hypothetical protein
MKEFLSLINVDPNSDLLYERFLDCLNDYEKKHIIQAINDYLDDYDKCKEFAKILNKKPRNRNE